MTSAIQMKLVKLLEMKTLIGRIRSFTTKVKKNLCRVCPKDRKTKQFFQEKNSTNETDAQKSPKRGDDIIVPEKSQNDEGNDNLSPRGGRYNLRPNPNRNYSEDLRY